jgi:hypothetical protein
MLILAAREGRSVSYLETIEWYTMLSQECVMDRGRLPIRRELVGWLAVKSGVMGQMTAALLRE